MTSRSLEALRRTAFWLSPPVFLLLVYWPGIGAWFQADDFAWLSLSRQLEGGESLLHLLFAPMAQGTIRPWSERGFFLLFQHWFGLHALPWRVFVYLNACAVLVLLSQITRRLTGSELSAWLAPLVWIVSAGLAIPMTWTSDYNQIQCALFLLAAFFFRLRRLYRAELLVFVLGFGSLEIEVVYPAIACAWVLCDAARRRRDFFELAPLFAISVAYFVIHAHFAPAQQTGPYALHFDGSVVGSLASYAQWTMLAPDWLEVHRHRKIAAAAIDLFAAGFAFAAFRGRRPAAFGTAWFLIALAPLLPLRDHVSSYYLTVPCVGFAIAVAAGVSAWSHVSRPAYARFAACAALSLFLEMNAAAAHFTSHWFAVRSQRVRGLVLGTVTARRQNPDKLILLDGLDPELLDIVIAHSAFNAIGVPDVLLTPESSAAVLRAGFPSQINPFIAPPGPVLHALREGRVVVFSMNGNGLRDITSPYKASAGALSKEIFPETVDVGNPLMAYLLGPGWYALESGHRWMSRRATVRLGVAEPVEVKPGVGPVLAKPGVSGESVGAGPRGVRHLVLSGWCPKPFVEAGPLKLEVAIDGEYLTPSEISKPETPFVRTFDVPDSVLRNVLQEKMRGNGSVLVQIEVSRTLRPPGENRDLGLAFGVVGFQP